MWLQFGCQWSNIVSLHCHINELAPLARGGLWAHHHLARPVDLRYWLSLLPRPSRSIPRIVRVSERTHPSHAGCCWFTAICLTRMLVAAISLWRICPVIAQSYAELRHRIDDTSASDSHVLAGGAQLFSQPASQSHILHMIFYVGGAKRMTTTA